jgi:hypothetical protein
MARFDLDVTADIKKAERYLSGVQKQAVPKAAARALNRTIDQVQTQSARAIRDETSMKSGEIQKHMKKERANPTRWAAALVAFPYTPNLIRFGARQTRKGVTAKVWGKRKLHRGTFIGNRDRTVFKRATQGGKRVGRLPIEPVHGPSLQRTFVTRKINEVMTTTAKGRWPVNFSREIKFYLSKVK